MAATVEKAKMVVDTLVQRIERDFKGFNVSEIVKGGSLGHGTVVFSGFDIDLVIYSRDISGQDVLNQHPGLYTKWVLQLKEFVQRAFGRDCTQLVSNKHSVQFRFQGIIDVDLLVSPYWSDNPRTAVGQDLAAFYRFLQRAPKDMREHFSVGASKWQVQFFAKQPPQVKEYARKAKQWKNENWSAGEDGRPTSYLMSLLVVIAYERNPNNVTGEIKALVRNGANMDECWENFYKKRDVSNLLPGRPRIVDPANPANNVWVTGLQRSGSTSSYEPGDGNRATLMRKIQTINLN